MVHTTPALRQRSRRRGAHQAWWHRCIAAPLSRPLPGAAPGFTLIEVLVALAIVAITLATGIKAAGALVQNGQRLAEVSAAQWCADNELVGLKLAHQFPGVGDSDFACEQLGAAYRGKLVVRPTPNPNFRRVEAFMADADGRPLYSLSTILPRY